MTVNITILGLGQVGCSIGLALAEARDQVTRTGNDKEPEIAKEAQKLGAIDQVVYTLPDAVEEADVVILALPVDEIRFTLETIAPYLKDGATVLDTSPVTVQSTQWAKEIITKPGHYFLTFTPAAGARYLHELDHGPSSAHADLFKNNIIMLTSAPGVDESAVSLAENLARLLGSTPIFSDPYEVDGLLSASYVLPGLIATALVNITAGKSGWSDNRKLAGARYARIADLAAYADSGKNPTLEVMHNRDNTIRNLDELIKELVEVREVLANSDDSALLARINQARSHHAAWLRQRATGKWEDPGSERPPMPSFGESISRLFTGRLFSGPKRDKDKGDDKTR